MQVALKSVENILRSDAFPAEELLKHNAFPDCVQYLGRTYLTFRTAQQHAPCRGSKIIVASQIKSGSWRIDQVFSSLEHDYRDPKILVYKDKLHICFGVVRANQHSFQPVGILHTMLLPDQTWSQPVPIYKPGYLLSRLRIIDDVVYMCVYAWNSKRPLNSEAKVITSSDMMDWGNNTKFGNLTQEGTESDCLLTPEGNLLWLIRRDISRKSNPGSALYLMNKNGEVINQIVTRIKFDSPLFISYKNNLFLVSRSQLRFKGNYLIGFRLLPKVLKTLISLVLYWLTQKTTTLWSVDSTALSLSKVIELPSQGDTGYCGYIDRGSGMFDIYNYSTIFEEKNASWRSGQKAAASIYRYSIVVS